VKGPNSNNLEMEKSGDLEKNINVWEERTQGNYGYPSTQVPQEKGRLHTRFHQRRDRRKKKGESGLTTWGNLPDASVIEREKHLSLALKSQKTPGKTKS